MTIRLVYVDFTGNLSWKPLDIFVHFNDLPTQFPIDSAISGNRMKILLFPKILRIKNDLGILIEHFFPFYISSY